MKEAKRPKRRSLRMRGLDYTSAGRFSVTISTYAGLPNCLLFKLDPDKETTRL